MRYDPEQEQELRTAKASQTPVVAELRERVDVMSARLSQVDFTYADPVRGFDRSQVKGLVANLIQLKSPKFATGVEVAAGGKLFNVVVETEEVGKLLLSKGQLKKRVTIIPLNKIKSESLSEKVCNYVRRCVLTRYRKWLPQRRLQGQRMFGQHCKLWALLVS